MAIDYTKVTDLKRHATMILRDAQEHGRPIYITEHGQPKAVLVDVKKYEADQERIETLLLILRGEKEIREGKLIPHREVEKELDEWLK